MWNKNLYLFILLSGVFLEAQTDEISTNLIICNKQNTLDSIKWLVSVLLVTEMTDVLIAPKFTWKQISPLLFLLFV